MNWRMRFWSDRIESFWIGSDRIGLDRSRYRVTHLTIQEITESSRWNLNIQIKCLVFQYSRYLNCLKKCFFSVFFELDLGAFYWCFFSPTINRNLMWNENAIIELNERREKLNVRIEKLTKNWVFSHIFQNCSESKGSISSLKNGCLVHWINAGSQRIN